MIHVLLTSPFRPEHLESFSDMEGFDFRWSEDPSPEQLNSAEIIMGNPEGEWISRSPSLRWIQLAFAGSNLQAAFPEVAEKKILLTNLSGAFGQSISEIVLCYVLMLYKHLQLYRDHQLRREWTDEGRQETPVGKRLLILGAGNIGEETARLFRPFGCEIIGLRRSSRDLPPCFDRIILLEELDAELPEADIVVCALPESAETRGMINARRLNLLKPSALLINVGRGSLIDQDALAEILQNNRIAGAALDVTDPEPLPASHSLWGCKNLILTPHISGGSFGHLRATEETLFKICKTNLRRYASGQPLLNLVDPAAGYRVPENRYS